MVTRNEVPDCKIPAGNVKLVAVVRKLVVEISGGDDDWFSWMMLTT